MPKFKKDIKQHPDTLGKLILPLNPILIAGRGYLVPSTGNDFKITTDPSRSQCHNLLMMSGMDEEVESKGLCNVKVTKWMTQVSLQN